MKLNCDLGESYGVWQLGNDQQVMPHIDMANIACGFHASDPLVMDTTVQLAITNNVEIGAHPGYPDLVGFGRRSLSCSDQELRALLVYQIGALNHIALLHGRAVRYVKPHGALYNDMMKNQAILDSIAGCPGELSLVIQATPMNSEYLTLAEKKGVKLLFEAFADRAYDDNGLLVSRDHPRAVYNDSNIILAQVKQLIEQGTVQSINGVTVPIDARTICVHGDNPQSVQLIAEIRRVVNGNPN